MAENPEDYVASKLEDSDNDDESDFLEDELLEMDR